MDEAEGLLGLRGGKVYAGPVGTRGWEPVPGNASCLPLTSPTRLRTFPQLKWCAWVAVYCSFISFANSRSSEDTKQMMSSFM